MLAREWPNLTTKELDTLAGSLAYEGDAHRSVFSGATTIWLDGGRHFSPEQLTCYAEGRLKIYQAHTVGDLAGRLPQLSQRIRDIAEPPAEGDERDRRLADSLLSELRGGISGVVIVGANHANEAVSGTMAFILRDRDVAIHRI